MQQSEDEEEQWNESGDAAGGASLDWKRRKLGRNVDCATTRSDPRACGIAIGIAFYGGIASPVETTIRQ